MADRRVVIGLGADNRDLTRTLNSSRTQLRKFGQDMRRELGASLKASFKGLSQAAGLAGAAGLAVLAREALGYQKQLDRLAIAADATRVQMVGMTGAINKAAQQFGVSQEELLAGVETYVALTGRFSEASKGLEAFGAIAAATGANMSEVAGAAARMQMNLGLSEAEMLSAFSVLHQQAKMGAVELKDLTGVLATVAPMFSEFNKSIPGPEKVAKLGATMQSLVKEGFATAAEAATGLSSLMTAILKKQDLLKGKGIRVFEEDGKTLLAIEKIVANISEKVSETDIPKLLGLAEAVRGYKALNKASREGTFAAFAGATGDIMKDAAKWAGTTAGQIEKAKAALQGAVNEALVRHADKLATAIEKVAHALAWVVDHGPQLAMAFAAIKAGGVIGSVGNIASVAAAGAATTAPRVSAMLSPKAQKAAAAAATRSNWRARVGTGIGYTGNVVTGAAIGYAAAQMLHDSGLGSEVENVRTAAMTLAGSLSQLPGPVGDAAKAVIALGVGLDWLLDWLGNKEQMEAVEKVDIEETAGAIARSLAAGERATVLEAGARLAGSGLGKAFGFKGDTLSAMALSERARERGAAENAESKLREWGVIRKDRSGKEIFDDKRLDAARKRAEVLGLSEPEIDQLLKVAGFVQGFGPGHVGPQRIDVRISLNDKGGLIALVENERRVRTITDATDDQLLSRLGP